MPSNEITVKTAGGAYGVLVEPGALSRLAAELSNGGLKAAATPSRPEPAAQRPLFVITDSNVWKYWGRAFDAAVSPLRYGLIKIRPGEEQKKLETVERISERLVALGADRGSLLIAFGGGVVGDIGGFVASVYLRGVDYVQAPTTLLAQIDSSVGGKTGVNLRCGKNLVGSFYQPKRVIADPRVFRTLPQRELRAGLYEAIKCGALRRSLFVFIEKRREALLRKDPEALAELVRSCVRLKARVVTRDEREGGLRRILNLGHTVGHALESETGYRHFLHGEAVAWGLRAATLLAEDRGMIRPAEAARIHALVKAMGPLPPLPPISAARLASRLLADKKTRGGAVHFVLPEAIGKVHIVTGIAPRSVARVLERLRSGE